jgi:hypothetical protein
MPCIQAQQDRAARPIAEHSNWARRAAFRDDATFVAAISDDRLRGDTRGSICRRRTLPLARVVAPSDNVRSLRIPGCGSRLEPDIADCDDGRRIEAPKRRFTMRIGSDTAGRSDGSNPASMDLKRSEVAAGHLPPDWTIIR